MESPGIFLSLLIPFLWIPVSVCKENMNSDAEWMNMSTSDETVSDSPFESLVFSVVTETNNPVDYLMIGIAGGVGILLIIVALILAWWVGKRRRERKEKLQAEIKSNEYFAESYWKGTEDLFTSQGIELQDLSQVLPGYEHPIDPDYGEPDHCTFSFFDDVTADVGNELDFHF
jgi:hypothetical protein